MSSTYYKTEHNDIEFVYSKNSKISYDQHNHISMFIIGIILDGKIALSRKNNTGICTVDDMFLIPPYEIHSIKAMEDPYSMLVLCVSNEFIELNSLSNADSIIEQLSKRIMDEQIVSSGHIEAYQAAVEMIYSMYHTPYKADQTEAARSILISEPENELRLEKLADDIYINKYYFIRKFKEEVGLTPHHFQVQNRIRKAQHLIQEGHTVVDAAVSVGFYDQSHFVKYFKKLVGMTPSKYLKSIRKL